MAQEIEANHAMKASVAIRSIGGAIRDLRVTTDTRNHRAALADMDMLHKLLTAAEQCRQIITAEAGYYAAKEAQRKIEE